MINANNTTIKQAAIYAATVIVSYSRGNQFRSLLATGWWLTRFKFLDMTSTCFSPVHARRQKKMRSSGTTAIIATNNSILLLCIFLYVDFVSNATETGFIDLLYSHRLVRHHLGLAHGAKSGSQTRPLYSLGSWRGIYLRNFLRLSTVLASTPRFRSLLRVSWRFYGWRNLGRVTDDKS